MKKLENYIIKNIDKMSTEELQDQLKVLKFNSKSFEENGSYVAKFTFGPLLAGVILSFLYLIPGLIMTSFIGILFATGCIYTFKSIKCDELIKKITEELGKRPEKPMKPAVLGKTYQPPNVKKYKVKKVEKENNVNLEL